MSLCNAGRFISRRLFGGTRNFCSNATATDKRIRSLGEELNVKTLERDVQSLGELFRQGELNATELVEKHMDLLTIGGEPSDSSFNLVDVVLFAVGVCFCGKQYSKYSKLSAKSPVSSQSETAE